MYAFVESKWFNLRMKLDQFRAERKKVFKKIKMYQIKSIVNIEIKF